MQGFVAPISAHPHRPTQQGKDGSMNQNTQISTGTNASFIAPPPPAGQFTRRIGGTTYRVSVHMSKTSRETMSDKITRMIKNEAESGRVSV